MAATYTVEQVNEWRWGVKNTRTGQVMCASADRAEMERRADRYNVLMGPKPTPRVINEKVGA